MPREYWIILGIAFVTAWITTPAFRRLAQSLNLTDQPSERKVHKVPVPYLGGLAFHAAMTAVLLYLYVFAPYVLEIQDVGVRLPALFLIAAAFQLLGVVDDVRPIPAAVKLLIQAVLSLALVWNGFLITQVTSPLGGSIPLGWTGWVLSVLWILTIINAINFIDGLDGLAAGVVFFAALANLVIALHPWQHFVCIISLTLLGATLGFLPYNFSPARIFMGDAGSLYLGVWIAGSALASNVKGATAMSLSLPLVILSLPLLDAFLTVVRRGRRGQRFLTADREHLHHRILRLGFSDRQAVLFAYGFCFFLAMSSILAAQLPDRFVFLFILVYLGWVVWGLLVFNALERRLILRNGSPDGPEATAIPNTPLPPESEA